MHGTIGMTRPGSQPTDIRISASDEIEAARRIFAFNWRLLASAACVVAVALITTDFRIEPLGYGTAFAIAALYGWAGVRNAQSAKHANPRIFCCLIALAQLLTAMPVILTLTYVAMSTDLPLQDARLMAWDRALGFDFRGFLDFANGRIEVIAVLARAYTSINLQFLGIVLLLPLAGYYRRAAEIICAGLLTILATTLIAMLVPAIGVYGELGLQPSDHPNIVPQAYYDTLRELPLLRAGALRGLDYSSLRGVLTFPSFHTAAAVLFMWACWPLRRVRLAVIPWNIAMIVATPLGGGHYLVDCLAGIVVAISAIVATRWISGICSRRATSSLQLAAHAGEVARGTAASPDAVVRTVRPV